MLIPSALFPPLRRALAALLSAAALLLPALVHAEDLPKVIRFGIPASVNAHGGSQKGSASTVGPVVIAALEKAFAGTGTKLEYKYFVNAGPGINEAFAGNQIDFAFYGDFPAIIARAGGIPIQLVVPASRGASDSYVVVPKDSPAKTIADLKGKRVSLNMGRPWMLTFSRLVESQGLSFSDFQIFNLVMPDGDAAVASHNVDAQVTLDGLQLQSRGLARILWSSHDAPLDWKFTADVFAREDFIKAYPLATQKIVTAYIRGARYNADPAHRDEYLNATATAQAIPPDLQFKAWQGREVAPVLSPLFDPFVAAHYQEVVDFAAKNKLIRRKFDVAAFLEPRFATQALKELNLTDYWTPVDAGGRPLKPGL